MECFSGKSLDINTSVTKPSSVDRGRFVISHHVIYMDQRMAYEYIYTNGMAVVPIYLSLNTKLEMEPCTCTSSRLIEIVTWHYYDSNQIGLIIQLIIELLFTFHSQYASACLTITINIYGC